LAGVLIVPINNKYLLLLIQIFFLVLMQQNFWSSIGLLLIRIGIVYTSCCV
jgi:uncharacterized membrane protein